VKARRNTYGSYHYQSLPWGTSLFTAYQVLWSNLSQTTGTIGWWEIEFKIVSNPLFPSAAQGHHSYHCNMLSSKWYVDWTALSIERLLSINRLFPTDHTGLQFHTHTCMTCVRWQCMMVVFFNLKLDWKLDHGTSFLFMIIFWETKHFLSSFKPRQKGPWKVLNSTYMWMW
jgi:hypothetical protein